MQRSSTPPRRRGPRGYGKGDDTRRRLVGEALRIFGERGYAAATTRELASAAGTTLPSLTYYFGGKEGLYVACAEEVVERFLDATGGAAAAAQADLDRSVTAEGARDHLKALFRALASLLTGPEAGHNAGFVREVLSGQGPAFDVLYGRLWGPGIELAAALITRASGGRLAPGTAKVRGIMMLASLTGFASGREIILHAVGPDDLGETVRTEVTAVLDEQIDEIYRAGARS